MIEKKISRIKANLLYFIFLMMLCFCCILLLFVIYCAINKTCDFREYINNILFGVMGSIVASIILWSFDRYKEFCEDCNFITYAITDLLQKFYYDNDDKENICIKDCIEFINDFKYIYYYIGEKSINYNINKHFSKILIHFKYANECLNKALREQDLEKKEKLLNTNISKMIENINSEIEKI